MTDLLQTILKWVDEDQATILRFMRDLITARTPNPPGDTRAAMEVVTAYLDRLGLPYRMCNRDERMPNLIASQNFGDGDRHLILNGHIDVFPVTTPHNWSVDAWDGEKEGMVWGRGSADMKVGTSASIMSYVYLSRLEEHLRGRLTLTVVSEEESFGPNGARHLFDTCPELISGTALLIGEPSGEKFVRIGEKGAVWLRMTVATPGGHGAYPHVSPNAIEKAYELIMDIKKLSRLRVDEPEAVVSALERARALYDQEYGQGASEVARKLTVNVGTISGGSNVNMIPSRCTFDVDIRIPNGATAEQLLEEIECLRERHDFTYEITLLNRPNWTSPDNELVQIVMEVAHAITKVRPVPGIGFGNTDARLWRYRGIPSAVYGPAPRGMGGVDEHVPLAEALNVLRTHVVSAAIYLSQAFIAAPLCNPQRHE